ncbi:serine/threonine protein kinase [Pendulispora rubella]|uniref:Serine/threonine protein kinase n=1 Tax=Pendulispora rubella TaxID=2741070 RepID=A0ABZ2LD76_9BACT
MTLRASLQSFEPGVILLGRYRVENVVGRGGMGAVLAAWDTELQHRVAIKVLSGFALAESEPVGRFMREARIVVKLQSDHVVRVFNAGTLETGVPYIVMDLLEGHDLGDQGLVPAQTAVDYVLQAIDAIAEAHAQNVVHRDLKPSNLFLANRVGAAPIIKVLDFGISKATNLEGDLSLTGSTSIMGSPRYMSPEQFRSAKQVDERTDVWALGAILYQLLAGIPPFDGTSMTEIFESVVHREPAPLHALRPEVPAALEQVILRCLRKAANERYATVAELALALAPFGTGEWQRCVERAAKLLADKSTLNAHVGWVAPAEKVLPLPSVSPPRPGPEGAPEPRGSRRRIAWMAASLFVVVLASVCVGAALMLAWVKRHPPQLATAAPSGAPVPALTTATIVADSGSVAADVDAGAAPDAGGALDAGTALAAASARKPGAGNPARVLTDFQRSRLLGHYSTYDGRRGFVLDRLGEPVKVRLDGDSTVHSLKERYSQWTWLDYLSEDGKIEIRTKQDTGEVVKLNYADVVRDADARPLR